MSTARVAIITGGAQGIGLEIALQLADDGLDIAVNDISSKSEKLQAVVSKIKVKGRRALAVTGDVSSEEDVRAMVEQVAKELGSVDVMVANAGIAPGGPLLDCSLGEWDRTMAINVRGVMLCYKYAAMQMIKQGRGGRIIGACSAAGKQGFANYAAYSTSKFAMRGLTQSAALELRQYNITVNAYAPGVILTDLVTSHPDDALNGGAGSTALKIAGLPITTPHATPDVVASLVSYLVKPESHFITGQALGVNGGIVFD
ncbi:hypothetical protein CERSUDRAFT_125283 [Gelatoporia subvermispora B]|uniref:NAD-binding protein n=1 Tax=Ceriporiopsis subvermispora (strain B) TaxID=914234 RepID=M2PFK5_CERS8|nr:hypothetical protein CERSUDRAFT_125283 [Gelatoporia subvermispora B]